MLDLEWLTKKIDWRGKRGKRKTLKRNGRIKNSSIIRLRRTRIKTLRRTLKIEDLKG
jgi:hypothetical protein